MVIENDNRGKEVDRVMTAQGEIKRQIDSNSLTKLKLLLQGAPLGAEGTAHSRKGAVSFS